ncbi:Spc98 family-domain-containing protein [Pilobolus umbonatus]|nr:Spc98 family-domain-containing protein [Pilobolus umbonatus]
MVYSIDNDIVESIITKITGLKKESPEWNLTVKKALNTLRYYKCTTTSEKEVENSYSGLLDRYAIKGHQELANMLETLKKKFLDPSYHLTKYKDDILLKYDMLKLLLVLTNSVESPKEYSINSDKTQEEEELTWSKLIEDDPLEGDHWKTWSMNDSSEEDNVTDDEDFELEKIKARPAATSAQTDMGMNEGLDSEMINKMEIDDREDYDSLKHIINEQYWRDDFRIKKDALDSVDLLKNPCQLGDELGKRLYSDAQRRLQKSIREADIIREILFLLKGGNTHLFSHKGDGNSVNKEYRVQHLSQNSLGNLLDEFCKFGDILSELRNAVTRMMKDVEYGQTCQAFASTVYRLLKDFEGSLSEVETDARFVSRNKSQSISLLRLKAHLHTSLECFKAIYDILIGAPFIEGDARQLSAYIISELYDCTAAAESSGQMTMYETLLYILNQTLIPYGRIMDDWIFHGTLSGDVFNEFFVSRNHSVGVDESSYWRKGFTLHQVSPEANTFKCPIFDPLTTARMFFTGRAVNILSRIGIPENMLQPITTSCKSFHSLSAHYLLSTQPFVHFKRSRPNQGIHSNDIFTNTIFPLLKSQDDSMTNAINSTNESREPGGYLDQMFNECIEHYIIEHYKMTAMSLNDILHRHCQLLEQLKFISSIYLMLENDLMHSFSEAIFINMDQQLSWFNERNLNMLFTEVCHTIGYNDTVYMKIAKENTNVSRDCSINSSSFLEAIRINVKIPWPLNYFIGEELCEEYSKITGLLFRLKRAKYNLEKKTLFGRRVNKREGDVNEMHFYLIRMRVLWFVNAFWSYIMTTILYAETINFRYKLSLSKDADDIADLYASFIRRISDRCLLNDHAISIRTSINHILDMTEQLAVIFATNMNGTEDISTEESQVLAARLIKLEKEFTRTNEFITTSLMILGKKGGFQWFETLAVSLSR